MQENIQAQIGYINFFLDIHPALVGDRLCLLNYDNASGFLLVEDPPIVHHGLPDQDDIALKINDCNLIASQALLTNSSLFSYSFTNLLSIRLNLDEDKVFNAAFLKICPKQGQQHAMSLSVIDHMNINSRGCQMILSVMDERGEKYLVIESSENFSFYDMVDITIRIAQSVCFLFSPFSFGKLMLLCGKDCFALTSDAHINGLPQFSIFTPPWNLQQYLSIQTVGSGEEQTSAMKRIEDVKKAMDTHAPHVAREFATKFMTLALEKDYFLYLLLFTNESTGVDVYSQTAQMMVALEIFANAEAESDAAKKEEMQKISSKLDKLIPEIKNLAERNFPDDDKLKYFVEKKLKGFKSLPNADRLKEFCESLGLKLDDRDKKTLNLRNNFFHGSLSKKITSLRSSIENYYAACRLVCELMARVAGYTGYICKFDRIFPHRPQKLPIGDVFVKI